MRKVLICSIALVAVLVALSSCQSGQPVQSEKKAENKHYALNGVIESVDHENHKAKIKHDNIPGFMDAMTMSYKIKDDAAFPTLKEGDQITADVVVDPESDLWLEKVVVVKKTGP